MVRYRQEHSDGRAYFERMLYPADEAGKIWVYEYYAVDSKTEEEYYSREYIPAERAEMMLKGENWEVLEW